MATATRRLFIGGLFPEVTDDDLKRRFEKFGDVTSVDVKRKGDEATFAFVNLKATEVSLAKCIALFNNSNWKGRDLRVEVARESFLDRLQRERESGLQVGVLEALEEMKEKTPPVKKSRTSVADDADVDKKKLKNSAKKKKSQNSDQLENSPKVSSQKVQVSLKTPRISLQKAVDVKKEQSSSSPKKIEKSLGQPSRKQKATEIGGDEIVENLIRTLKEEDEADSDHDGVPDFAGTSNVQLARNRSQAAEKMRDMMFPKKKGEWKKFLRQWNLQELLNEADEIEQEAKKKKQKKKSKKVKELEEERQWYRQKEAEKKKKEMQEPKKVEEIQTVEVEEAKEVKRKKKKLWRKEKVEEDEEMEDPSLVEREWRKRLEGFSAWSDEMREEEPALITKKEEHSKSLKRGSKPPKNKEHSSEEPEVSKKKEEYSKPARKKLEPSEESKTLRKEQDPPRPLKKEPKPRRKRGKGESVDYEVVKRQEVRRDEGLDERLKQLALSRLGASGEEDVNLQEEVQSQFRILENVVEKAKKTEGKKSFETYSGVRRFDPTDPNHVSLLLKPRRTKRPVVASDVTENIEGDVVEDTTTTLKEGHEIEVDEALVASSRSSFLHVENEHGEMSGNKKRKKEEVEGESGPTVLKRKKQAATVDGTKVKKKAEDGVPEEKKMTKKKKVGKNPTIKKDGKISKASKKRQKKEISKEEESKEKMPQEEPVLPRFYEVSDDLKERFSFVKTSQPTASSSSGFSFSQIFQEKLGPDAQGKNVDISQAWKPKKLKKRRTTEDNEKDDKTWEQSNGNIGGEPSKKNSFFGNPIGTEEEVLKFLSEAKGQSEEDRRKQWNEERPALMALIKKRMVGALRRKRPRKPRLGDKMAAVRRKR